MAYLYLQGEERREGNSPSWFNSQEITVVIEYLKKITSGPNAVSCDEIGVISPYKQQVTHSFYTHYL